MEMETDRNRPSTIRIIAGIIVLLCGFPVFWVCCYGMWRFTNWSYEELWIFEYVWGKLLILFVSGMIFLMSIGLILVGVLIATKIWMGKSRMMEHIIYPFPTVLTAELADSMNVERADDKFFVFNPSSLIRSTLIVIGGILSCAGIIVIYREINDPSSDLYSPPISGGIVASFFLLLNGLFAPSRRFVLDRMKGTVTFPRHLFFPRCTIPFSKVIPGYSNGNLGFAHPYSGIVIPVLVRMIPAGGHFMSSIWIKIVRYLKGTLSILTGRKTFYAGRQKDSLNRYILIPYLLQMLIWVIYMVRMSLSRDYLK